MLHLRIMVHFDSSQELLKFVFSVFIHLGVLLLVSNTLVKTLALVSAQNRSIKSRLIWLNVLLEPITSFFIVRGISKSIANEFHSRKYEKEKSPALSQGLTYSLLALSSYSGFFLLLSGVLPSYFATVVAILYFSKIFFMVQFWSKVVGYKTLLEENEITEEQTIMEDEIQ